MLIKFIPFLVISDDSEEAGTALTTLHSGVRPTMRPFYVLEQDEIISPPPVPVLDEGPHVPPDLTSTTASPPIFDPRLEEIETSDSDDDDDSIFGSDFGIGGENGTINVINQVIIASLWIWWKEVLGISLLTAVLLNIILMRPLMRAVRMQTIRDMIRYFRDLANRDQVECNCISLMLN